MSQQTRAAAPRELQELSETVQRSRLGGPFYVVLWGLAGLASDLWETHALTFFVLGAAFVGFTVARFRARSLPAGASRIAVARRLNEIWAIVLGNAAVWGAASAWLLFASPTESSRTVVMICSFAFTTAFAHNFCMRLYRTFAAVALLSLPTLVAFSLGGARYEIVVVGLMYLIYVSLASKRGHVEYLQRLDLEDELRRQRDLYEQQSTRDSLTALPNRRYFTSVLQRWVEEAREAPLPFALLILDLDWFKAINDRHGHAVGDACLRAFAEQLQQAFGTSQDVVARLGGEEFAVLIRDCAVTVALQRADTFRETLAGRPLPIAGLALGLTVSIGVGGFEPDEHDDGDAFFQAVDKALYTAKASGRNAVRVAQLAA